MAVGTVVAVEAMSPTDHGMGNNVIIKHVLPGPNCSVIYSSYSNLASLGVQVNQPVAKGQPLGLLAGSLHFELKSAAVTGNPWGTGQQNSSCDTDPANAGANSCWRFTTTAPDEQGYLNPGLYLNKTMTGPTYRQVAVGGVHTCAVKPDGTVTCWGYNGYDQQATPPAGAFKAVSATGGYTCGVRSDGFMICWGNRVR